MIPPPGPVTIIAPRGLGDACVCLPSCYDYVRRGFTVNMLNAGATNFAATLPTLVPIGVKTEGEIIDISMGLSFHSEMRMLSMVALRLGIMPAPPPADAWLARPPEYADIVAGLGVPEDYVMVAPMGFQSNRRMDMAQVAALAEEWPVVTVHDKPLDTPGMDLTGQTSLVELYALTAMARAVVSVDTGVLHLAGAFHTPVLAVIGNTLNPYSFCQDYGHSLWLSGQDAWTIDPASCVTALDMLLEEAGA